jgi:hypothetical protein
MRLEARSRLCQSTATSPTSSVSSMLRLASKLISFRGNEDSDSWKYQKWSTPFLTNSTEGFITFEQLMALIHLSVKLLERLKSSEVRLFVNRWESSLVDDQRFPFTASWVGLNVLYKVSILSSASSTIQCV